MKVVFGSMTCIRYMPTLRPPLWGSCVITAGRVINGAGSPGQQRWIGRRPRSTSSPRRTISWQTPLPTVFGRESAMDLSFCKPRTFSISPLGGCISSTSATRCATSSSFSTPRARHIRRSVPNWLIRSGCFALFGRSKSSAGPPALTVRSTISVISRSGSTSAETRTSSPSRSSSAIHSRRSFAGTARVYGRKLVRPRARGGASPASGRAHRARSRRRTRRPCPASAGRPCSLPPPRSPRRRAGGGRRRPRLEPSSGRPLDEEIGEVRRALPELPPAANFRSYEGRAATVDEGDHGYTLGDCIAVGLVEPLEATAVAALLPRGLDQLVEDRVGEPALVRATRRLEEEAEVVLGVGIAGQPAGDANPALRRPAM